MAKKDKAVDGIQVVTRNRRAAHEYELTERLECGLVLVGTEVKSLRDGHCSLDGSYAKIESGELWLIDCEIPEYAMGNRLNHKPKRDRKLLAHRRELAKFAGKASERGFTLVPTSVYFKNGRAKVEIAVARGKQLYDKRQALKTADAKREMDRAVSRRR
ncbi:MAG TPA: SsrA-binding protein SmpB [Gemmataceae bacterium]|jgi:SsrA-binding protein|nr:SsrA-binding protein SmpB [Gemmataceae bacterium]